MKVSVGLVTGNFFDVMGLSPVLGRLTRPSDDGPGVPAVMVLTHDFWMRHFGGDPGVVGKQVTLEAGTATVIGVVQPAPYFPDRVDALMNMVVSQHHLSAQMIQGRTHRMTEMIARLAPAGDGRSRPGSKWTAFTPTCSATTPTRTIRVRTTASRSFRSSRHWAIARDSRLLLLMVAAAFVLVITAANVVNLTLMRGVRREPELVVRAALGAGVARLRRLLLAENLVLALAGAVLGVLIAIGGVKLLVAFATRYSSRSNEITLDGVALGFALTLSLGVALLLSFVASLPKEGRFASWISTGSRRMSGGLSRQRLQRGLVVAQIAVSVMLLAGAGLLTRTMIQLSEVNTGLRTEEVLTLPLQLLSFGDGDFARIMAGDAAAKEGYDRIRREILALPGVVAVGVGSSMPLRGSSVGFDVKAEGKALASGEAIPRADVRTADPEYFRASGIPLVKGRGFATTDRQGSGRVVILNQALADRLFPGEDPIGKHVAWTGDALRFTPFSSDWRTIVGVVGNTRDGGLDAEFSAAMYMPFAQELAFGGGLVIRADSNVAALVTAATRIAHHIAPTVPIDNVLTIAQIKDQSVAPRRLNAELLSLFSILAVVIAAVGIAGVLAFSVSARTNEIGIRMSLGADRGRVERMILREGGVLLALGLVLGVGGAFAAAGAIRGLLFGVAPHDPATFIGVALMMAAIGIGACWIPALRAARIDPAVAMRA